MAENLYLQPSSASGVVYRPLIQVSFHTEKALFHVKSGAANPNNQLVSVTTQKQLGTPAGLWTLTLVGTQYAGRIDPQDVAVIQMGYAGESKLTTVMVGLVDKVNRKRAMGGDGKPTINTMITGRDFGKLFVKDMLKFYPEISGKKASDFFLTDVGWINLMKVFTTDNIMKGTPAVIGDNIMKYIFPKLHDVSWTLWNESASKPAKKTVNVKNIIHYQFAKIGFFMPFIFTADQYEGALWNLLDRCAPKPFCELFIDTRDGYEVHHEESKNKKDTKRLQSPYSDRLLPQTIEKRSTLKSSVMFSFGQDKAKVIIALRETPYDTKLRNRLKKWKIAQRDVINDDLTVTDEQHYNLFWAGTTINPLGIDLKRVSPPLLNEKNAKKYGLSPLEVNIEGMEIKDQKTLEGMSKEQTVKLKEWYQNNHTYWGGNLEIRGIANIRVGQMVEYDNLGWDMEYYVEGVNQNFNIYQGWTTTLTLTRGMPVGTVVNGDKSDDPVKKKTVKKEATKDTKSKSTTYTVTKGDTLWGIAKKKYGDATKWTRIWEANKDMLIKRDKRNKTDHGHWIYPGQKLVIPAK